MSILLSKFLKKIGVEKYEDLNTEEKDTYREWEASLEGRRLTDDDVKGFLQTELDLAIGRLTDENIKLNSEADIFRKVEVRFIKKVMNFLDMPAVEKKLLEKQLESKII